MTHSAWEAFRKQDHFGSLDGLRCLSILAVVWHHGPGVEASGLLSRGYYGVPLFFGISGFLITTLLLRERERNGSVSLRRFYARRTLRIFPLYFAVLGLYIAIASTVLEPARSAEFFAALPFYLTYTSNWLPDETITFGFAWSLAAEEQFYSTWPFLVSRLSLRVAAGIMVVLFAISMTGGFYSTLPIPIIGGSLMALALHSRRGFTWVWPLLAWRGTPWVILTAAVVGLSFAISYQVVTVHPMLVLLVGACVVREDHAMAWLLRLRPVAYIGTISYGMYLLHGLLYASMGLNPFGWSPHSVSGFLVAAPLTVLVATLSYRYFEGPFLRWKRRFEARR